MRTALATLVLLLLGPVPAEAETPAQVADRVLEAIRGGDPGLIATIAAIADEGAADPWAVVDALATAAEYDAATAFAAALSGPDVEQLPAYAASRRTAPANRAAREALHASRSATGPDEEQAALDRLTANPAEGDRFLQARIEFGQGALLLSLKRATEAALAFDRAAAQAASVGCLSLAADALIQEGLAAHRDLDYDGMLSAWQRWQALERTRKNAWAVMQSSAYLGNVYVELGTYDRALEEYAAAEAVAREHGDAPYLRFVLQNAAVAHLRRGNHRRTQAALEEALALSSQLADAPGAAELRQDLADLHFLTGEYETARSLHAAALEYFEQRTEAEDNVGIARSRAGLGFVEQARGHLEESLAHFAEALRIFREEQDIHRVGVVLTNISSLHLGAGDPAEALPPLQEALAIAREIHDPWLEANALLGLALQHHQRGEDAEAEAAQARALDAAAGLASPILLADAQDQLATMRLARRRYAEAAEAAERSILHQTTLLTGMAEEQGARARARRSGVYATGAHAAIALEDVGRLAMFLENGRAGSFLESLQGRDAIRKASVPAALIEAEQRARLAEAQAVAQFQQAVREGNRKSIGAHREALDQAREAVQRVVHQIQRDAKRVAEVLYPSPAPLPEIQATLGSGEVFVLYLLLEGASVALVVTPTGSRIVELAGREAISAAVERALEPLSDRQSDPAAALDTLRGLVITPLDLDSEVHRLVLSLDGALFRLPFAPLIGEREVVFVPSGTSYKVLREQRRPRGDGVFALGDPDYRSEQRLSRLLASRPEVEGVGTSTLLGKAATEANLRTGLEREEPWRAVHLACHGLMDTKRPMLSLLALAQSSAEDDGGLTALEVFSLEVRAELVVLSACDTGRGEILEGAGLVGLSRAFLFAGAGSVLVSLWKVDDAATGALMLKFYELWNPKDGSMGQPPATALRNAQKHVASHPQWSHPYYWAAWVLWGLPD